MKTVDFTQFLIKIDRKKAPKRPRGRNIPVWEVVSTTETTHVESDVTIYLYNQGGLSASYPFLRAIPESPQYTSGIKWDGKWQWNGMAQWGDG